jgi:hypothetical protein
MMEPPDSHGSSRHNASILSGIDRGTVTVRWKVVVDARAVVVEESPQGLRDVAVLAVSQGVVPIDDRHAAAEHHHVVFFGIRHVLAQEVIPPGRRSRRPSTARDVSASEDAMAGSTGITPGLLLGGDDFDLDQVGDRHACPLQHADDMPPGKLGLTRDVLRPRKEEDWSYALPKFQESPATVAISLDGTSTLMCEDGWREAMVGTLAFYDREGQRQHTIYLAATPEYGKAKFLGHLETEIERAQAKCPDAHDVGIADGAKGNWEFLGRHTDVQVTDFWHAAEYLGKAAVVLYRGHPRTREAWLEEACHCLKHELGGAEWVLKQLRRLARERPWARGHEDVQRAITYFTNQSGAGRMDYASRVAAHEPIGSGVTEAACKVIIKQRLCGSGMKWTEGGAAAVLSLRTLSYTSERWNQFWSKVDRWGFPVAS